MKNFLLLLTLLITNITCAQDSYDQVVGTLWDENYAEPIVQAIVIAKSENETYRTITDLDGKFTFTDLPSGTYSISFAYLGITTLYGTAVKIQKGIERICYLQHSIKLPEMSHCPPIKPRYVIPEHPTMERKYLRESVNKFQLPELVSGMNSEFMLNNENQLQFQGSRNSCLQLIDGVKTLGFNTIPAGTLRRITVYNGFIPANYGDTNGSVIVIETIGYFDLLIERQGWND